MEATGIGLYYTQETFYSRAGCTGRLRAEAKGLGRIWDKDTAQEFVLVV